MDRERLNRARFEARADRELAELERRMHDRQVREKIAGAVGSIRGVAAELLEDDDIRKAVFLITFSTSASLVLMVARRLLHGRATDSGIGSKPPGNPGGDEATEHHQPA